MGDTATRTDFELFLGEKKPRSYLPGEWRDYFGTPVERHEESCIFADTLRRIGSPKRICFLIAEDGRTMLLRAHRKRDLQSHKVPGDVYSGGRSLEISSQKLCQILAELHGWNMERSYRVPDMVAQEALWVVFHLDKA